MPCLLTMSIAITCWLQGQFKQCTCGEIAHMWMRAGNTCGRVVRWNKSNDWNVSWRKDPILNPLEILCGYDRGSFLNQGLYSRAGREWESIILWMERDWSSQHMRQQHTCCGICMTHKLLCLSSNWNSTTHAVSCLPLLRGRSNHSITMICITRTMICIQRVLNDDSIHIRPNQNSEDTKYIDHDVVPLFGYYHRLLFLRRMAGSWMMIQFTFDLIKTLKTLMIFIISCKNFNHTSCPAMTRTTHTWC
jgi:hypothetical protein